MKYFYTILTPYVSIQDTIVDDVKSNDFTARKKLEETNRKLKTQK